MNSFRRKNSLPHLVFTSSERRAVICLVRRACQKPARSPEIPDEQHNRDHSDNDANSHCPRRHAVTSQSKVHGLRNQDERKQRRLEHELVAKPFRSWARRTPCDREVLRISRQPSHYLPTDLLSLLTLQRKQHIDPPSPSGRHHFLRVVNQTPN